MTDRTDKTGRCKTGLAPVIYGFGPHFGEEACLVGNNGSGTIFFSGCNLACVFCQNFEISQLAQGNIISCEALADVMLELQSKGCHNINLVTPTHQILQITRSLEIALNKGLSIPTVYNSGGYDSADTLKILDGIIDIYMPDFKLWYNNKAKEFLGVKDYQKVASDAITEMYRQVGDLRLDNKGIAQKGLIIRHLILPDCLEDTEHILKFIRDEISKNTYVNLMGHYHPCWKAEEISGLNRTLTLQELTEALHLAQKIGLKRIDTTHLELLRVMLK